MDLCNFWSLKSHRKSALKEGTPVLAKILTLDAAKIQEALDCFCAKILQWKQWHFAKRSCYCTLAIWQLVMQLVYCTLMMLQWRWTRVQLYIAKFSFYTCLICVLITSANFVPPYYLSVHNLGLSLIQSDPCGGFVVKLCMIVGR